MELHPIFWLSLWLTPIYVVGVVLMITNDELPGNLFLGALVTFSVAILLFAVTLQWTIKDVSKSLRERKSQRKTR